MANIIIYEPNGIVANRVAQHLLSVNTPDYDNVEFKLVNPDVSGLSSILTKYWKVDALSVVEMTIEEKAVIDNSEPKTVVVPDIVCEMFYNGIAKTGKFLDIRSGLSSNSSSFYCLENFNLFRICINTEQIATATIGVFDVSDFETSIFTISLSNEASKDTDCNIDLSKSDRIAIKIISGQIINSLIYLYLKVRS